MLHAKKASRGRYHALACRTRYCFTNSVRPSVRHIVVLYINEWPVVKEWGLGGHPAPAPIWASLQYMSMSPLIILCLNNTKLVGLEWVWGLLQPGFVGWAPLLHKTTLTTANDLVKLLSTTQSKAPVVSCFEVTAVTFSQGNLLSRGDKYIIVVAMRFSIEINRLLSWKR